MSFLTPTFLSRLSDDSIRTILICGCGGGFDFLHSLLLYPELRRMNKTIIFSSFSFGNVKEISEGYTVIANEGLHSEVRLVNAQSVGSVYYQPEILLCRYLDQVEPEIEHSVYANNARSFSVHELKEFYEYLVETHDIDAVVIFDGGTDSLMVGDEPGLGDPIEDCVSVSAVSLLDERIVKVLIAVGFGADRFNDVLDTSSFRAVAEITELGGMIGVLSIENNSICHQFYRNGIDYIYDNQSFKSVLTGLILESIQGNYGLIVPKGLENRVKQGDAYCWPLMSFLWAFDVNIVAKRSQLSSIFIDCVDLEEINLKFLLYRKKLKRSKSIRKDLV